MTNIPGFNFDTFDSVSSAWRAAGNAAVNPAERDREWLIEEKGEGARPEDFDGYTTGDVPAYSKATNFQYHKAMKWDISQVINECDSIIMLPGWEKSSGAKAERFAAELTGKTVVLASRKYDGQSLLASRRGWHFFLDPEQKQLQVTLIGVPV